MRDTCAGRGAAVIDTVCFSSRLVLVWCVRASYLVGDGVTDIKLGYMLGSSKGRAGKCLKNLWLPFCFRVH